MRIFSLEEKKDKNDCEPAGAALLHDFSSVVARELAESIVTVDNGPIHNLGVPQNKIGVWHKTSKRKLVL